MPTYLALLETAGNQRFIFATNKLRENVGASELTYSACKTWVWRAVHPGVAEDEMDIKANPPLGPGVPVQILLATSGKAYLLTDSADAARRVIRDVTTAALKDAPGLDLAGVYVELLPTGLDETIQEAHKMLASRRGIFPGPESRFLRLPVVAECATSGLPAAQSDADPDRRPQDRSAVTIAKRGAAQAGIDRMRDTARQWGNVEIVGHLEQLDKLWGSKWLAVVHCDGNGLGRVFLKFQEHAAAANNEDYVVRLQRFSKALDRCTEKAFGIALQGLKWRLKSDGHKPLPVAPIVLGGDDMTVVMDGKYAIQFTIDFLTAFEKLTARKDLEVFGDVIPATMRGKGGSHPECVTACAGVAVVKPHFPFYAAYELAEGLIQCAKRFAKGIDSDRPPSALDFHILYDASGADLDRIRASLTVDDGTTELFARPYLVSDDATNQRSTASLATLMRAIRERDAEDDRRTIPNSQLHDLRSALFGGKANAEARYRLVTHRYKEAFTKLLPAGLFWRDGARFRTHLLDAIDLCEFWADASEQEAAP